MGEALGQRRDTNLGQWARSVNPPGQEDILTHLLLLSALYKVCHTRAVAALKCLGYKSEICPKQHKERKTNLKRT